jgi:hypothetical protein
VSLNTLQMDSRDQEELPRINACVLPLNRKAVAKLEMCEWFSSRRTVVYGLGGVHEALRFIDLGIHALVTSRSDMSVHSAVDATQPLLARGVGECARVPIATPVKINAERRTFAGLTRNVGLGGMAASLMRAADLPENLRVTFVLPSAGAVSVDASPCWYSGRIVGLRFRESAHTKTIKSWVLKYSSLGCGS